MAVGDTPVRGKGQISEHHRWQQEYSTVHRKVWMLSRHTKVRMLSLMGGINDRF